MVCGGGLAGVCAAVSAARHGAKVVLVQDRPMLGGNASSEMRMGICGAHGDQNYEAGLLEEMQLENFCRKPLQRYTLWDDVIYSTVVREKNVALLLNTSVNGVEMDGSRIAYGVWEYTKNHPDGRCRGCDLDWIGSLPGKRERMRFG